MLCWIKQLGTLFFFVSILCMPQQGHASNTLTLQESNYRQIYKQVLKLQSQHAAQFRQVQRAANQISILKKQAQRGGLFAIPARVRLPRVRAEAQSLTKRMSLLTLHLYNKRKQLKQAHRLLLHQYRKQLRSLRKQVRSRQSSVATRQRAQRLLQSMNKRYQQLRANRLKSTKKVRVRSQVSVKIHPLDGPRELRQKSDRVKDAEDHVNRILRKLKKKIRRVRKKMKRQKNESQLEHFVDSSEDLFNENSRNPRIVTGNRTSQKMRAKNAERGSLKAPSTTTDQAPTHKDTPNVRNPSPTSPRTGAGQPNSPPTYGKNQENGFKNGNNAANKGVRSIKPPQHVNPSLQPRATQTQAGRKGLTLHPSGSPAQQLRALKLYKLYLKKRIEQLRKKQSSILKRAKQLKQERRRRRR